MEIKPIFYKKSFAYADITGYAELFFVFNIVESVVNSSWRPINFSDLAEDLAKEQVGK